MNIELPSSFEEEYQALRSGRGFYELPGWSSISVTGADRQVFLHNFCTNDIKRLVPGASCEAFFTNVKGRIIGHGVVGCRSDELVIVCSPGQTSRLIEHLDRYIIREDVQLFDTSDFRKYNYVARDGEGSDDGIPWYLLGNAKGRIIELPAYSGISPSPVAALDAFPFRSVSTHAFSAARIEAGFPLFGFDISEENLPQEVGRDRQAISFTKGCYLGQETVARIDALGHVNQQLVGIRFFGSHVPAPGTELVLAGTKVGRITSAAFSPRLGAPLAIAMVRRTSNSINTRLESVAGECEVVAFPASDSSNN
jgi:folate-binding protein YgfZ